MDAGGGEESGRHLEEWVGVGRPVERLPSGRREEERGGREGGVKTGGGGFAGREERARRSF